MDQHRMNKSQIMISLEMLGQEPAAAGRTGEILLGGEAVMVLIVGNRSNVRTIATAS